MTIYGFTCSACGKGVSPDAPNHLTQRPNYCRYCGAKLSEGDILVRNIDKTEPPEK